MAIIVQEEESRAREKVRELDSSCRSMIPMQLRSGYGMSGKVR